MRSLVLSCLFAGIVVGCAQQPPPAPAPAKGGININVPGVNITIDEKGGTNVEAPGVKVEAGPKGAKVQAPNVNVNVPADK